MTGVNGKPNSEFAGQWKQQASRLRMFPGKGTQMIELDLAPTLRLKPSQPAPCPERIPYPASTRAITIEISNARKRNMSHTIILPYFCDDEVARYLKIVQHIDRLCQRQAETSPDSDVSFQFLLAASPRTDCSETLRQACEAVAPTHSFQCPTQIFGYPAGPTAMFWDAMDYVAEHLDDSGAFALWLESDMIPVKADWLQRLDQEWNATDITPLVMGCYVPELYKKRVLREKRLVLHEHINGGACYHTQLARLLPADIRDEVFDMAVYRHARQVGVTVCSEQIMFSTTTRARRDILNPELVLLHGFMQDKDRFIEICCEDVSDFELKTQPLNGLLDAIDNVQRLVRTMWIRRGRQAVLENMFLEKRKLSRQNRRRAA